MALDVEKRTNGGAAIEYPRVDIRDKVTGAAHYVEDVPDLPGTVYAVAVRSPFSHANIVSVDSSRARAVPGVLAVMDPTSLSEYDVQLGFESHANVIMTHHQLIATDRARFDGDVVGMVAAEDLRTARYAASLVDIEWDILAPLFSHREALADGAPLLHEDAGSNVAVADDLEWGDVEGGLRESDYVYEGVFTSPTIYHHPIEPGMSMLVNYTTEGIEIWSQSNQPFDVASDVAALFGIAADHVRVHVPYVGGNFGSKHNASETLSATALSMKLGRPVKFLATEEDSFRQTARHHVDYRVKVGVKLDGTIVAMDVVLDMDTGAYFTGAQIATGNAVTSAWSGYRVPNLRVRARTAYTNKVPAAMFRNTGKSQTAFGSDAAMDAVARHLGIAPIEFRQKNMMKRGETIPVKTWKRNGKESDARIPLMDTDYAELMEQAVAAIGWDGRAPGPILVEGSSRRLRGRGMACSVRRGSHIGSATAMASMDRDGMVTIWQNAPDVGEGAHTVISIVAAGTLGIPQDQIVVSETDTGNQLHFSGTSSQRVTVQMGNAVRNACDEFKKVLQSAAARVYGGAADEWSISNGVLRRGMTMLSFAELAQRLPVEAGGAVLRARGDYVHGGPIVSARFGDHDHWSPGVAAVEVDVDTETGGVRVLQYAAVADAGHIMHYHSARGQIEGGAIMGFGASLTEELIYDEGQLMNADPFQYRLPLMSDIPEQFRTILLEHGDGPGPFGSKGIAQTSIPCVAPAIANAIYDAVGVRLGSIPFTPEKILQGIEALPR
ncbi:MAG: Xanthine dehydrogenase family protein molybdopterin-binding subunit [Chloroflexi bacterium]|nr:Xanthine dehydrogenase family protein molybdopterin-binding subunit [Chloroflexota bacterium]